MGGWIHRGGVERGSSRLRQRNTVHSPSAADSMADIQTQHLILDRDGDATQKPFFSFRGIALFFSDLAQLFSEFEKKTSTFFRYQATFFRSIYSILAYSTGNTPPPTGRSRSDPPPNPQPHPKMVFFYARRPGGGLGMGLPKQQQISDVVTTIFRAINNKFQKS